MVKASLFFDINIKNNTFFKKVPSELEIQCKKGMYFSFNIGWYCIQLVH